MRKPFRVGVQLWTLRDDWQSDPQGTLRRLAQLGFEGIEVYGDLPKPAEVLREWLDDLGLQVAAAHLGPSLEIDYARRLEEARVLRHNHFVFSFPSDPFQSDATAEQMAAAALTMHRRLSSDGLRMSLHHHEWEFSSRDRGLRFLQTCAPIGIEFDLFWLATAGLHPVEMVRSHASRVALLHAKDGIPKRDIPMVALGQGQVPNLEAIDAAIAAQAPLEWVLLELDECAGDFWEALEKGKAHLDRHWNQSDRSRLNL
jgi:sugar phosphate isomerase/epimerase